MSRKYRYYILALAAAIVIWQEWLGGESASAPAGQPIAYDIGDALMQDALDKKMNDLPVAGEGTVVKVLSDDNEGSRHQRFIIELNSGQTLLIAHNIDLAPRIPGIRRGDRVQFKGVYEWNDQGGVVHWTHHDPAGRQEGGWLEHRGQRYE